MNLQTFRQTLESGYDHQRFTLLLRELLREVNIIAPDKDINGPENFPGIISYRHIGNYSCSESENMALLSVCVANNSRSIQRNFVRKLLENNALDGAIAAFWNPDNHDTWRLSLVRLDYSFRDGKLSVDITPGRQR